MSYEHEQHEGSLIYRDELVLTEVDHLLAARRSDGSYNAAAVQDVFANLVPAVQEAGMPYAITTTEHEVEIDPQTRQRTFRWLGRTALENAASGRRFHVHPAALDRVAVEEDEAVFGEEQLRLGQAHVFISPRMSRFDATLEEARQEHLGDDDAVRVSWLRQNPDGSQTRVMQSLLVRDVPLQAWVSLLAAQDNLFGGSIDIENPESALSVMKVHRSLVIDRACVPEGPLSILKAVVPHIADTTLQKTVAADIQNYHGDQADMQRKAEAVAQRWLSFELALAESLATGWATNDVTDFIYTMRTLWNDEDMTVLQKHLYNGQVHMTRKLAVTIERAKRHVLWVSAAVVSGNQKVIDQIDTDVYEQVYHTEMLIQLARENGLDTRQLEQENSRLIGAQDIEVGGGCPGDSGAQFRKQNGDADDKSENKIMSCPHCSAKVYDDPCARILKCGSCHALVINGQTISKGNKQKIKQVAQKAKAEKAAQAAQKARLEATQRVAEVAVAAGASHE